MVTESFTATLNNETVASPTVTGGAFFPGGSSGNTTLQAAAAASGTLTMPSAVDTLVARANTDTVTNKTFDTAGAGDVFKINGTQVSTVTGGGSTVVLSTAPSISCTASIIRAAQE